MSQQSTSSRSEAFGARRGLSLLDARLAKREAAVVAALTEADPEAQIDPQELRRFAAARVARERTAWREAQAASVATLFDSRFGAPAGRYRIEYRRDPIARLQWAERAAGEAGWQLAVLVAMQLTATATSWRVARADLGFKRYAIVSAWWTLRREGGDWALAAVEPVERGHHYTQDPLPNVSQDAALHDRATIALALADAAPVGVDVAPLAEVSAPVRRQLLDLSLLDGRWAPDAIAACVGEIARAWEAATERGEHGELERWSSPEAAWQLCRPTPNGVRRVRNLALRWVQIEALAAREGMRIVEVAVSFRGLRWLADLHGSHAPLSGSERAERTFTERWTLAFTPDGDVPWRVTEVRAPGRR